MFPMPSPLLEYTRVHTWVCNVQRTQCAPLCPRSSNQCSHSGQLEVSLAHCPGLAGSRFPLPQGGGVPAASWPSTTFPSLGGEQAQWALTPWGWNPVQPSLPQVMRTGGRPQRLGQQSRQQSRGQYHPGCIEGGWSSRSRLGPI